MMWSDNMMENCWGYKPLKPLDEMTYEEKLENVRRFLMWKKRFPRGDKYAAVAKYIKNHPPTTNKTIADIFTIAKRPVTTEYVRRVRKSLGPEYAIDSRKLAREHKNAVVTISHIDYDVAVDQ